MNLETSSPEPQSQGHLILAEMSFAEDPEERKMAQAELEPRKILVPIDFSPASVNALTHAVSIAKRYGAKITLLHVTEAQFYGNESAYLPINESAASLESIARDIVPPELLGDILVRNGVASDEIAGTAEQLDIDLIVVNTHGYTGFKHVLRGSTAERIVRRAPCPVLVVREYQDETG